jgi:hypothetical protein
MVIPPKEFGGRSGTSMLEQRLTTQDPFATTLTV